MIRSTHLAALLAAAFVIAAFFASPALADDSSDVIELTPANFDEHVGRSTSAFVKFYAPWCGHCVKLAPEYEKFASAFKSVDHVRVAKVNCDAHRTLCNNHGVSGFPTLKWLPAGGAPEDYVGGRHAGSMADFVNSRMGTSVKVEGAETESRIVPLTTWSFPHIILDEKRHVLVLFYEPKLKQLSKIMKTLEDLATAFKDEKSVAVAKVDVEAESMLAGRFKLEKFPHLKFFTIQNKYGEDYPSISSISSSYALSDLVSFVNKHAGTKRTATGGVAVDEGLCTKKETCSG